MGYLKPVSNPSLSGGDAAKIMVWLHGPNDLKPKDYTKKDRGFAEAVLMDMIRMSFAMGFTEALFRSAIKLPSGPKAVIIAFLKSAGKNLLRHLDQKDAEKAKKDPKIYKSVFNVAKLRTKSIWGARLATGEAMY